MRCTYIRGGRKEADSNDFLLLWVWWLQMSKSAYKAQWGKELNPLLYG